MKRMVSNVKSEKLLQELKDLETRGDDELKERWRSLYGTEPPRKIHRSLLIAADGYRMQENALGGLKPAARRHLLGVARFSRGCDAVNMLSAETCGGRFRRGSGPRSHGFAYSREDALCDLEILPAPS